MSRIALTLLLASLPFQCGIWGESRADKKAAREAKRAERAAEQAMIRQEAEKMRRRLWREKQYAKVVDGLKDHLAKGRFKYLVMGTMLGVLVTSSGIWIYCHDGCRFFNPPPKTIAASHNPKTKPKKQPNQ